MNTDRAKMVAELIKHLEEMDGQELAAGMKPPEAPVVDVEVAELDPDKTKQFEDGFNKALGTPKPTPPGGKTAMLDGADPASAMDDEEMDDDEFEEMMKLNA